MAILKNKNTPQDVLWRTLYSWNDLIAPCLFSFDASDGGIYLPKKHREIYWDREVAYFRDEIGFDIEEIEPRENPDGDYEEAKTNWEDLGKFTVTQDIVSSVAGAVPAVTKAVQERIRLLRSDDYLCGRKFARHLTDQDRYTPRVIVEDGMEEKKREEGQDLQDRIADLRRRIARNTKFSHLPRTHGCDIQLRELEAELESLLAKFWRG